MVEQITTRGYHFSFPHELDYKVGEAVQRLVPGVDLLRFTCSGTEGTMAAMRLARAYTGKEKIIKFEGCYHGWSRRPLRQLLARAEHDGRPGQRAACRSRTARGRPGVADTLIIQPFNDPRRWSGRSRAATGTSRRC